MDVRADTGVRLVYRNTVYASYSSWVLSFSMEMTEYTEQVQSLKMCVIRFKNTIEDLKPPAANSEKTLQRVHQTILKLLRQESQELIQQHEHLDQLFGTLTKLVLSERRPRDKRAILNLGGVLSTLFGTASQDQVDNLKEGIRLLKNSQQKVITVLEDSLSVLNSTNREVHRNRVAINSLVNRTEILTFRLHALFRQVTNFTPLLHFTDMVAGINMISNSLSRATNALYMDMSDFYMLITGALKGSLSVKLIPPSMLSELLAHIKRNLPPEVSLPFSIRNKHGLLAYYRLLSTTLIPGRDAFQLVAVVPLLHKATEFQIYQAVSVPIPGPASDTLHEASLPNRYLAISQDRSHYVTLRETEVMSCLLPTSVFCQFRKPIYLSASAPTCISAIFLDDVQASLKLCEYTSVRPTELPIIKPLVKGKWLVYTPKPLSGSIECLESEKRRNRHFTIPVGVSVFPLEPRCMAHSTLFSLPYFLNEETLASLKDPSPNFRNWSTLFPLSDDPQSPLPTDEPFPVLPTLPPLPPPDFDTDRRALEDARNDLANIDNTPSTTPPTWTLVALGPALTIIVVIAVGIYLIRRKQARSRLSVITKDMGKGSAPTVPLVNYPLIPIANLHPSSSTDTTSLRGQKRPRLDAIDIDIDDDEC